MRYFIYVLVIYVGVASVTYRFKHPEMTETQLFIHLPDAMLWK